MLESVSSSGCEQLLQLMLGRLPDQPATLGHRWCYGSKDDLE